MRKKVITNVRAFKDNVADFIVLPKLVDPNEIEIEVKYPPFDASQESVQITIELGRTGFIFRTPEKLNGSGCESFTLKYDGEFHNPEGDSKFNDLKVHSNPFIPIYVSIEEESAEFFS